MSLPYSEKIACNIVSLKMSYDLRRLRHKGLIYRKPGGTRRYPTPYGLKVSLFPIRVHARLLRPKNDRKLRARASAQRIPTTLRARISIDMERSSE